MTKEVSIKITGRQTDETGQASKISVSLCGEWYERGSSVYVFYDEKDPDNGAVTKNALKLSGSVVTHSRKGAVTSQMTFEAGRNMKTDYRTPYGSFLLELRTETVSILRAEDACTVRIVYELYADDAFLSANQLTVRIRSLR